MKKDFGKQDEQTGNKGKPEVPKGKGAGMAGVKNPGKLGTSVTITKK